MVRCRCKTLLFRFLMTTLIILAALLLYVSEISLGKSCSKTVSMEMLQKLCALYATSKVDGNLCSKICSPESFHYEKCLYRIHGKKVIQVELDGRRVVLKSRHHELSDFDPIFKGALDQDDKQHAVRFMSQESFMNFIRSRIQTTLGTEITTTDEDLSHNLFFQSTTQQLNQIKMNSLWTLIQQEEYVFFTLFRNTSFFPNIYGSCGHVYAEEYIPPGAILQPSPSQSIMERYHAAAWTTRIKAAIDLLDIIKATETGFKDVLHLCDVKPENFGISKSKVKAIDIDLSFFDRTMSNFLEQPTCTKHADCDFFDCLGVCNLETKKCTRKRKDNNFQAICRDIFSHKFDNPGLLRGPPPAISEQVSQLLHKCINPDESERVTIGSSTQTFQMLYSLLKTSLKDNVS